MIMNSELALLLAVVAVLSGLLTTGLIALRAMGIDYPKDHSLHVVPTSRLGGVAVMMSTFAGVVMTGWIIAGELDRSVAVTVASTFGLFLCFLFEDFSGLSWKTRLGIQFLTATVFLYASGTRLLVSQVVPPAIDSPLLDLAIVTGMVWAMNLYNFMDGMDGLAGGMSVTGFITLALLAFLTGHDWVGITASAAVAASLGFVAFNLPPAKIFLGDAGSVPLGFLGAALGVILVSRAAVHPAVPLLAFAPFVIDATTTLLTRALRRTAFWQPHRQHWYQRMVLAGWSHGRTLAIYYPLMLTSAIGAIAFHYDWRPGRVAVVAIVLLGHTVLPTLAANIEASHGSSRGDHKVVDSGRIG